jgi:nucleoid-associated protein YgaU
MADQVSVEINRSFLLNQTLRELDDGTVTWGRFEPPAIENRPTELDQTHQIQKRQTPRQIADQFYGNQSLWWIIAYVNELTIPAAEMVPGEELIIPDPEWVERNFSD